MRIGLSPQFMQITYPGATAGEFLTQSLPDEIRKATLHAAEVLANMGAEIIEDVPMPHTVYSIPTYYVISRVEAASNLHRFDGVKYGYRTTSDFEDLHEMFRKTRAEGFGLQPKLRVLMGTLFSTAHYNERYYHRALRMRSLIRSDFDSALIRRALTVWALLTPPPPPFKMGDVYGDSVLMQYADQMTVPANHAGIPALSIPVGMDHQGLPIGVQLLGPDFMEETLFRMGYAFEQGTAQESWRKAKPKILENGNGALL